MQACTVIAKMVLERTGKITGYLIHQLKALESRITVQICEEVYKNTAIPNAI